jgi:hypothetical protein
MSIEDPREPRFDTPPAERPPPAERLGPADPLGEPRLAPEPSVAAPRSWLPLAGGVAAAVVLAGVIVTWTHRGSAPSSVPAVAEAPSPVPAATPEPASPPATPAPAAIAQTPAPAPVAPPPARPAVTAPPPQVPAARAPVKHAAVPSNGPKHKRRVPGPATPWLVQAGAFKSRDHARAIAASLIKRGWNARTNAQSDGWVVIEVTGYKTRAEADAAATKLASKERLPTLVRRVNLPGAASAHKPARPPRKPDFDTDQ